MPVFIFGVKGSALHSSMCRWNCLCEDILELLHRSDLCPWRTWRWLCGLWLMGQSSGKTLNGRRELWRVLTLYDGVRKNWNLKLACAYADNQPGSPSTFFWLEIGLRNSQTQDELCMWGLAQMSEFSHEFSSCHVFQRPNISTAEK